MPKDEVPVLTLNPAEPPLRVAQALGRPVAIVRMGVRKPTIEEIQGRPRRRCRPRLGRQHRLRTVPVPHLRRRNAACPAGRSARPRPAPGNRFCPRDEYLCDGGDRGTPATQGKPAMSAESIRATPSSASISGSKAASSPRPADQRRLHLRTPLCRSTRQHRPQPEY